MLLDASRGATSSDTTPVVLADAGVENVNAQVDALISTGVLRRMVVVYFQIVTKLGGTAYADAKAAASIPTET